MAESETQQNEKEGPVFNIAEGVRLNKNGNLEYDPLYLNTKIREKLGFSSDYMYQSEDEEYKVRQGMSKLEIA